MSAIFYALVGRTRLNPLETKRFVKFTVVGAIGAVVDFGSFNLLIGLFDGLSFGSEQLRPTIASTFSFLLAIVSNFIWNRYWTYPDSRSKPLWRQFSQFVLVNASALLVRWPIVTFTHEPFEVLVGRLVPALTPYAARLGENMALALAVGIAMFWNFFVNRYWTYSDVGKA